VPIPEAQLKQWATQGPADVAAQALALVTRAMGGMDAKRYGRPDISLSGTYASEANIEGDEPDVVVLFRDVFYPDVSGLNAHDRAIYERERSSGRFSIADARAHVQSLLLKQFGDENVRLGERAIRLDLPGGAGVNVYAACGHKYFYTFPSKPASRFVEGIVYADYQGREIVDYPAQHAASGAQKAQQCSGFRPAVRVMRRLAAHLEGAGKLRPGTWSPYFVECMVYNVPNSSFYTTLESTVLSVLMHWSSGKAKWDEWLQQNQVVKLFGAKESQWDKAHAEEFVEACRSAYDGWG
jgi:hypothetical protein